VDAELNKEMEQWHEMLRNDVVKLCQDNDFNTGFFECTESVNAIDAYELKVICSKGEHAANYPFS
jgi:atypical dual specificity phosphatase